MFAEFGVLNYLTYLVGAVFIILVPGPNTFFVLKTGIAHGVKKGYLAAAGVFIGDAVLMFLASSLNIQLRKSDYAGLAVICSCMGLAAACWFATGLLGITLLDVAKIWGNIKDVMIEVMSQTPPEWPMMMT